MLVNHPSLCEWNLAVIWCFLPSKRLFITTRRLFPLFSLVGFGIWGEPLKHVYYVAKRHCVHPSPHLHLFFKPFISFFPSPFFYRILSCLYPVFTLSTISCISFIYYACSLSFHNPACTSCFQFLPLLGYFFPVFKLSFSLFLLSISFYLLCFTAFRLCFLLTPIVFFYFDPPPQLFLSFQSFPSLNKHFGDGRMQEIKITEQRKTVWDESTPLVTVRVSGLCRWHERACVCVCECGSAAPSRCWLCLIECSLA